MRPDQLNLLERLGVRVFAADEVARRGLGAVTQEALAIAGDGLAFFGVTLDIAALDPQDAPAVATPAAFGLREPELLTALRLLSADPRLAAVEIAEYCPRLDRDGRTERLIQRLLVAALGGSAEEAQVAADALH